MFSPNPVLLIVSVARVEISNMQDESVNVLMDENRQSRQVNSPKKWKYCIIGSISVVVLLLTLLGKGTNAPSAVGKFAADEDSKNLPHLSGNIDACNVYCYGPILHAVQMNLKADGKDFVDRPMRVGPKLVLRAFHQLKNHSESTLKLFLKQYFYPPGSDLLPMIPKDFQDHPQVLDKIRNETLRSWAIELNDLWKLLGRMPNIKHENHHSFLRTKHLLVVPGGRFRESYYWDTYWIMHGLLACDMLDTAFGVVQNLIDFVNLYGFVPNGGRIYYLTRSQPPMLSEMVKVLMEARFDIDFLKQATNALDKEYDYWMTTGKYGHGIRVKDPNREKYYTLNRYNAKTTKPRPESYKEDVQTASVYHNESDKQHVYHELASGAETGWDFSSRWLKDHETLHTIMASQIIPVDLNCIMHRMEKNLNEFHTTLNQNHLALKYEKAIESRQEGITAILWNATENNWKDYLLDRNAQSSVISISNYFPLWSQSFDINNKHITHSILKSLQSSGLIRPGGLETTTLKTHQQWDKPNAWPPMQDLIIDGLHHLPNNTLAHTLSRSFLTKWINTGLIAWERTNFMYEKYNATGIGLVGGGGEYNLQLGFGWTNGVILKMLTQHADSL